jgi:hypothetical protein
MIPTLRQKLAEIGKSCCQSESLIGQEKGRGVKLTPSPRGKAIKIKVDDKDAESRNVGLITDTKKCDCLYFYELSNKRQAFLVELKGNNYADALEQLAVTKAHSNYQQLLNAVNPCNETAVAIVGEKAKTNNPKKEEWERENNIRLKVVPLERDTTYDLIKDFS